MKLFSFATAVLAVLPCCVLAQPEGVSGAAFKSPMFVISPRVSVVTTGLVAMVYLCSGVSSAMAGTVQ